MTESTMSAVAAGVGAVDAPTALEPALDNPPRQRLESTLRSIGPLTVAVSGGVDSMTLAALAHRLLPGVRMVHAASAAVPPEATARVRAWALREGWQLDVIDAGEFTNDAYRANPVNRCFHCKSQLYVSIRARTTGPIVSGANVSDLGEYRPGLDAAREHEVRHPYVEAVIDKAGVRALSRALGLGDVAELASSPCLSSRVETGIRIEPRLLGFVHAVETMIANDMAPKTVRCRVRAGGVVVELDVEHLRALSESASARWRERIAALPLAPRDTTVRFEPYRNGSAFLQT